MNLWNNSFFIIINNEEGNKLFIVSEKGTNGPEIQQGKFRLNVSNFLMIKAPKT